MDFVTIPNEHNLAWDQAQQLFPKENRVFGTKVTLKGACAELNLSQLWTDQQSTKEIQMLMMIQTSAGGGCVSTWRPTAFER
jgi:hypothetical protein